MIDDRVNGLGFACSTLLAGVAVGSMLLGGCADLRDRLMPGSQTQQVVSGARRAPALNPAGEGGMTMQSDPSASGVASSSMQPQKELTPYDMYGPTGEISAPSSQMKQGSPSPQSSEGGFFNRWFGGEENKKQAAYMPRRAPVENTTALAGTSNAMPGMMPPMLDETSTQMSAAAPVSPVGQMPQPLLATPVDPGATPAPFAAQLVPLPPTSAEASAQMDASMPQSLTPVFEPEPMDYAAPVRPESPASELQMQTAMEPSVTPEKRGFFKRWFNWGNKDEAVAEPSKPRESSPAVSTAELAPQDPMPAPQDVSQEPFPRLQDVPPVSSPVEAFRDDKAPMQQAMDEMAQEREMTEQARQDLQRDSMPSEPQPVEQAAQKDIAPPVTLSTPEPEPVIQTARLPDELPLSSRDVPIAEPITLTPMPPPVSPQTAALPEPEPLVRQPSPMAHSAMEPIMLAPMPPPVGDDVSADRGHRYVPAAEPIQLRPLSAAGMDNARFLRESRYAARRANSIRTAYTH